MAAASSLAEDAEDAELLARMAKSYCGDAYYRVAAASIQVHGGIGFTWEHDCHLYFKRAKADQLLFGDGAGQRMRVGELLGISGVRTPN
jgi:alkylation response protein AidB-like acyl-CoA dehydrogenase